MLLKDLLRERGSRREALWFKCTWARLICRVHVAASMIRIRARVTAMHCWSKSGSRNLQCLATPLHCVVRRWGGNMNETLSVSMRSNSALFAEMDWERAKWPITRRCGHRKGVTTTVLLRIMNGVQRACRRNFVFLSSYPSLPVDESDQMWHVEAGL